VTAPPLRNRALSVVVVLLAVQVGLLVAICNVVRHVRPVIAVQIPAFALSLLVLVLLSRLRLSRRAMSLLLLSGCAVLQLAALTGHPTTSDDDFRYSWDAKVQLAGVDPYRYAPQDPALARLRETFTFPAEQPCLHYQVPGGCTLINRPSVHTIYPPVAQVAFDAARLFSLGGHGGHLPLQLAAALGVLATTWLLIRLARRRDGPLWPVGVWALSPIVANEATSNAHIEWLAVLFLVASLLALRSGRRGLAGVAIGAAIATKLYPGLMLVTAGRRPVRMVASATAVVALSYLPHVLAVGPRVIGYLPQYLKDESYSSGGRYLVVQWVVGQHLASYLAPVLLLGGLLALWWWGDPAQPERTAVASVGLYVLITTPNYAWYGLMLIALIAASGRWEWLYLGFAPGLLYMAAEVHWDPHVVSVYAYGTALIPIVLVSTRRMLATPRVRPGSGAAASD
jgi:alpha-1,2-mannosyltransferase